MAERLQMELAFQKPNEQYVITLKEITDLIGVEHNKAMRKVEELALEEGFGGLAKTATPTYNPDGSVNRYIDTYQFTKKQAIAVGARLNNTMLMKVIDRLEELEKQNHQNYKVPQTFAEALLLAAQLVEERDNAIKTKAEIGSRREATAMATASVAVKQANKLQIELDRSKEYCTIKRMTMLTHGQTFSFKLLRDASNEMNIPAIDIYDANYGTVKAYHKDVWLEVYGLDF